MLPSDRRQQILLLLDERGSVTITSLSNVFQVSEMTIRRDLDELAAEGLLQKVRGGAMSLKAETAVSDRCVICQKRPSYRTQVILQLAPNRQYFACCPHCGLMCLLQNERQVESMLVTGFIYGRTLAGHTAHYLTHPDISICCAPTILAFEQEEDVARFQVGFGGQICTLNGALAFLREAMSLKKMKDGAGWRV